MAKKQLAKTLEDLYKQISQEAAETLTKYLNDVDIEVSKNFTKKIENKVYDQIIIKVE